MQREKNHLKFIPSNVEVWLHVLKFLLFLLFQSALLLTSDSELLLHQLMSYNFLESNAQVSCVVVVGGWHGAELNSRLTWVSQLYCECLGCRMVKVVITLAVSFIIMMIFRCHTEDTWLMTGNRTFAKLTWKNTQPDWVCVTQRKLFCASKHSWVL